MARAQSKDERSKIVLFGLSSRAKRKAGCPRLGWEDFIMKEREMKISWKGANREALEFGMAKERG